MYVCICNTVTDSDIRKAVDDGVANMRQLRQVTGCGTTCGCCKETAVEVLQHALTDARKTRHMLSNMQIA
jgi:bacterioferritin-associated ferredoxin